MEFNSVGLTPVVVLNLVVGAFFTFAYFYQLVYMLWVLLLGIVRLPRAATSHSFAFVIAAHNEELVIANLVRSILEQDYDGKIACFVVADNCTDSTAEVARGAGAICWDVPLELR